MWRRPGRQAKPYVPYTRWRRASKITQHHNTTCRIKIARGATLVLLRGRKNKAMVEFNPVYRKINKRKTLSTCCGTRRSCWFSDSYICCLLIALLMTRASFDKPPSCPAMQLSIYCTSHITQSCDDDYWCDAAMAATAGCALLSVLCTGVPT